MLGVIKCDLAASARLHRALRWLVLAICVYSAIRGLRATLKTDTSDFGIYYRAGAAVLRGEDPLSVRDYLYLPFFAVCVAPLALLPYAVAALLWQSGALLALAWSTSITAELVRDGRARVGDWLDWAPLACVLRLADSNLGNGQVNTLTLFLVLCGLRAWRDRRELPAGAWVGFAAALKIVPFCLVLFFLVRGAWRAIVASAATAVACALLLPALVLGWSEHSSALGRWFESETRPYIAGGEALLERRPYVPGQSLTAAAYRYLSATPATARADGTTANYLDLAPGEVALVVRVLQGSLALVLLGSLLRARRGARDGNDGWKHQAALVISAALLLAPLVHKAHMVWLILPFAVLLRDERRWSSRMLHALRWALVVFAVLAIGATSPALLGRFFATLALAHNAIFLGALAVFAALVADVWLAEAREPAALAFVQHTHEGSS